MRTAYHRAHVQPTEKLAPRATRYDKTASSFLAFLMMASAKLDAFCPRDLTRQNVLAERQHVCVIES
jgi:hypothetical protein